MASKHNFEHLRLLLTHQGSALLHGGGPKPESQTVANKAKREGHSKALADASDVLAAGWKSRVAQLDEKQAEIAAKGIPILLKVDPGLDLDALREKFDFEIVSEEEEGFVVVASEDIDLVAFRAMVQDFAGNVHGSARIAQVHKLFDDPQQTERLRQILSEQLFAEWPNIADGKLYMVDIGVACVGTKDIPKPPVRGKRDTDATWAQKEREWSEARVDAYAAWDEIKRSRETQIERFAELYAGEILDVIDGTSIDLGAALDSFTVRIRISGKGLRDIVFNYPYIFEVFEPEDIALPQSEGPAPKPDRPTGFPTAPDSDEPAVCVIDSGVQESHILLGPAIDSATSKCFLPGKAESDVGDFVAPGGHGTRVAGAVLYGEVIAKDGTPQLPFWIQNARVLDENNTMPRELFPPKLLRAVVRHYHFGPRKTRIFNHSINANAPCRTRHMSAWAAEIDSLCSDLDVLLIQTSGNLPISGSAPHLGVRDHLLAGRKYPRYLREASARVANPAQSLQAISVGSVGYGDIQNEFHRTFGKKPGHPSAFSRSGFGIWDVIKPEVVEFGGDDIHIKDQPAEVQNGGPLPDACPELVRSTMFPPGPAYDRDDTGTSFAAPKVARIAAKLQSMMPDEPALLYRALVIQSAQWPEWAENYLTQLRQPSLEPAQRQTLMEKAAGVIRCIGFGVPDESRATTNSSFRTTLVTFGDRRVRARECHIYQVPIPASLREQADDFDIRIEVTLSYVAQPRRTRRNLRRYLSTWVDWKSSRLGEGLGDFRKRALKDDEGESSPLPGSVLPWALHERTTDGLIRDTRRNSGTVQKDWAVVKSHSLPDQFCIAVVGHQGWSRDPDSTASYSLVVSFEALNQEISIYEPLRVAVDELESQLDVPEVEVEVDEE